jgi:argininosuccinate lyase
MKNPKGPKSRFPHPSYLRHVLKPNFQHSARYFFRPLSEINQAHIIMLTRCGIVGRSEGRTILRALIDIGKKNDGARNYDYKGAEEDLYFYMEKQLETLCGPEIAGYLSVARSRNDVDITLYRMLLRGNLLESAKQIATLREVLIELSRHHLNTIFPVVTHTQLAQPTTLAHYFMAAVEFLERDSMRFTRAFQTVNQCPLGACVATTTGFPVDRALVCRLLGFDRVLENAYGCIASVDYLIESVGVVSTLMISLGRLIQDLLLWSSQDSQLIRLSDGFVQCSSIMPQKRNPVALEHLRVLASNALGQCQAIIWGLHNTPFGDIVDAEDDIQPTVRSIFDYTSRVLDLLAEVLRTTSFNKERAFSKCKSNEITLTELADWLVRVHHLPFRSSHQIVSQVATELQYTPSRRTGESHSQRVSSLTEKHSQAVLGRAIQISPDQMSEILDPVRFVETRSIIGGPAPSVVSRGVQQHARNLNSHLSWLQKQEHSLQVYNQQLSSL